MSPKGPRTRKGIETAAGHRSVIPVRSGPKGPRTRKGIETVLLLPVNGLCPDLRASATALAKTLINSLGWQQIK